MEEIVLMIVDDRIRRFGKLAFLIMGREFRGTLPITQSISRGKEGWRISYDVSRRKRSPIIADPIHI